ncbi:1,4-dihydroxy-6-naphtoate synthase [bacterium HR17]|uniref:1,4-dihydroxy-6-naphtoate synthase n=1 Tax=Candidatus Fervidibacter japonicus TaxID=2035412 RepID=A0A2H5XAN5_9BACT|nr:1,4-dihydroxy-6-naphtoate synthase [bacterium HR17]
MLTLGHSPDADDAFMFYAMTNGKVDTRPIRYEHILRDIQTLNELLLQGALDISAASVHACAYLAHRYAILTSGASMGDGYGPIVVAREPHPIADLRRLPVAVPGTLTTAFLALRLCVGNFPFVVLPFDRIMDAVQAGEVPFGLLIHEGQLTYADAGLVKVLDLGEWWAGETGLPLPLGVNVVRRALPAEVQRMVLAHVRASVAYALSHRDEALAYAHQFGRGMDTARAQRFVGMYVNALTVDMGERGQQAIALLLQRAADAGYVPHAPITFVSR